MTFWGKSQDNFIVNAAENKHILTMPKFTSHFSGYCYWIGLHIFYLLPEQLYTPMETLLIRFT